MKKLFTKHKFTQKIFLSIIMVLLLSFAVPVSSHAGIGGLLMDPIVDLIGTIGDVVVGGLQLFLVDGQMNNGDDGGLFNLFMIDPKTFEEDQDNPDYDEFKYNPGEDGVPTETISEDDLDNKYYIPALKYTPQKIFSGLIPALDINFVNPTDWGDGDDGAMNSRSIARQLHGTIASWYVALRNLCIVGLMLVLVYVGIRIVISSAASDKAKYKQMLMDWCIALCLVFCMHYIMTFTTAIITEISSAINGTNANNNGNNISVQVTEGHDISSVEITDDGNVNVTRGDKNNGSVTIGNNIYDIRDGEVFWIMNESGVIGGGVGSRVPKDTERYNQVMAQFDKENANNTDNTTNNNNASTTSSGSGGVSFNTDLMGLIRFKMQYNNGWNKLLFLIFYIAMVIYTCMFTFAYLKRVLTMAFLTLISPLVALTYPIDKIKDGKAQAFDMWFKEYIFNALLQPFHLIIYSVFVGSAIDLAAKNPLFAIVALAFITPAEKILRKFFGFEKSSTSGVLGAAAGVAGGAAAFNMLGKALNRKGGGSSSSKGKGNVRTKNRVEGDIPKLGEVLSGGENPQIRQNANSEEEKTPQQKMLDAYDEKFGTNEFDAQERDAMAREAYRGSGGMNYSADEYAQILRDSGYEESDINAMVNDAYGQSSSDNTTMSRRLSSSAQSVREMAKSRMKNIPKPIKGVANVAKRAGISAVRGGVGLAGKAAAAVPGAVLGMAAGIAGSDLSDIAKYTVAGGALTSATLPGIASSAGSSMSEAYREGAYGTTESQVAQREREFVKSNDWDDVIQSEFGTETKAELKAKKQQVAYFDARGIEGKDAIKAAKLEDKIMKEVGPEDGVPDTQAYAARIMKIAKSVSDKELRSESGIKGVTSQVYNEIKKGGLSDSDAKKQADLAVKYIAKAKGIELTN